LPVQKFEFEAIATVRSDYKEKFAIPRQANLAPAARAYLEVDPFWVHRGALDGLHQASHLWLQFVFHAVAGHKCSGRVRPPRLGGNQKIGVFATRATHRPNPIGLSVVRLLSVDGARVHIAGADLLDGTPILDIKPYLPWSDCVTDAEHQFAAEAPQFLHVTFSDTALANLQQLPDTECARVKALLEQSLGQDPRPAYQRDQAERVYGVQIACYEVRWQHPTDNTVFVLSIEANT